MSIYWYWFSIDNRGGVTFLASLLIVHQKTPPIKVWRWIGEALGWNGLQIKWSLAAWWELGEKQIEKITRMTQLCGLSGLFCLQLWENSLMLSLQTTESTWGVIAEVEATHITSSICFSLGKKASILGETFSGCHFRCNNSKMIALKLSLTCWKKTGRPPYWGGKRSIHMGPDPEGPWTPTKKS